MLAAAASPCASKLQARCCGRGQSGVLHQHGASLGGKTAEAEIDSSVRPGQVIVMIVPDQHAQGAILQPGQGHDLRPLPHAVQPQCLDTGIGAALDLQPAPPISPRIPKTFKTGRSIPPVASTRKPVKYG